MPLDIIPGKPEKLRLLWQAYTWVLVATLLRLPFYRMQARAAPAALEEDGCAACRGPAFAAAIFFAIAYVLNHSGKAAARSPHRPLGHGAPTGPEHGRR